MQPNLTQKYTTMSPGNPFILGSKGQRSKSWGTKKTVPARVFALLWVLAFSSCILYSGMSQLQHRFALWIHEKRRFVFHINANAWKFNCTLLNSVYYGKHRSNLNFKRALHCRKIPINFGIFSYISYPVNCTKLQYLYTLVNAECLWTNMILLTRMAFSYGFWREKKRRGFVVIGDGSCINISRLHCVLFSTNRRHDLPTEKYTVREYR